MIIPLAFSCDKQYDYFKPAKGAELEMGWNWNNGRGNVMLMVGLALENRMKKKTSVYWTTL